MEPEYPSHAPSEIDPDAQRVVASTDTSDMDTENSSITTTPSGHQFVDNGDFLFEPQPVNSSDDDKARNADSDLFTSVATQQQEQEERRQAQQLQLLEEQQEHQEEHQHQQQQLINSNTPAYLHSINSHQGPPSNPLRQKMAILHPALVADQLPSTKAPTVYALASSVPFPTVNQLSINLRNQSTTSEKVAVPFKTILHPPAIAVASAPGKVPSSMSIDELSPVVSTTPSDTMDTDSIQQSPSHVPFASTVETNEQQPNQGDVHPYFAASNLPIRPRTNLPNGSVSSRATSPLPSSAANGWSIMDTGLISPPLSTTFFTPSSNSTLAPVHHAMHDQQLDPNLVQRTAEEHQIHSDAVATAAGESVSIGSRSTVFGFTPLVNPGDLQDHMQTNEERVLSDGHCQTMPLDTPSRLSDAGQSVPAADPTGAPHVRAGISPTLNLDQVETRPMEQQKEASVESLVNSKDWSTTGLGPRSSWPVELSVLMPMLMRSASPLAIYWGDQSLLIYNDVSVTGLFFT